MNISDNIAGWLHEKGINDAFGIIGSGNIAMWDSIARLAKTKIHCFHHEQAALQAAVFYHRTTGRHAACLVTTGAGSSNAITGILCAWMDSAPLLIIAGNEATKFLAENVRAKGAQGFDFSVTVGKTMTKSSICLRPEYGKENLIQFFDDAYRIMNEPRQGPCVVTVPVDIQNMAA